MSTTDPGRDTYTQPKLLATLERLLAIQATALEPAL